MIVAKACGLSLPKIYYSVAHVSYDSFALDGPPFETLEISPRFSSMKIVSAKIIKRSRPIYPLRITMGNRLNAPLYYRAAFRSSFSASSKNYYIRAGFRDLSRGTRDFRSKPRSRSRPYTVIETELLRSRNLLSSMEMIRR